MRRTNGRTRYLLCVRNERCEDLQVRKLYQHFPDRRGSEEGLVRVVDDSGEDYLYPASNFLAIELSPEALRALRRRSRRTAL